MCQKLRQIVSKCYCFSLKDNIKTITIQFTILEI